MDRNYSILLYNWINSAKAAGIHYRTLNHNSTNELIITAVHKIVLFLQLATDASFINDKTEVLLINNNNRSFLF